MNQYRTGPETNRLAHRALTVEDAQAFFALNSHPKVMRHTGEPPLESVNQARDAILNYADFDTVGYGRWACVLKESLEVIGFCGLKYLPDLDVVDVGYRFLPEYWGRGLATVACAASIEFGFQTLRLEQIVAFALAENPASIRVLEKAGMHTDGEVIYDGIPALRYAIER